MPRIPTALLLGLLLLPAAARAELILQESFDEQGVWKKRVQGKGSVELVGGGVEGQCIKLTSVDQAFVMYSRDLPIERVRGKRVIVRAKVKLDHLVQGPKSYSMAKVKLLIHEGKRVINKPNNFDGHEDWHDRVLVAPVSNEATRVELQLAIQNGTGTAYFDNVTVDDGVKEHDALDFKPLANANLATGVADDGTGRWVDLGLPGLKLVPVADVKLAGADFYVMDSRRRFGRSCIVLRGAARPELPTRLPQVLAVGAKAKRLFFLHAGVGIDASRQTPCLVCTVRYEDGQSVDIPMREGVDMGDFNAPKDLPNWKVGWTAKHNGGSIGLGVSAWTNPRADVAISHLSLSTPGTGAMPIVVAISVDPKRK